MGHAFWRGQKLDWAHIYIEAPQAEAEVIFYNMTGRNPNKITCTCCGEDYSISEYKTLAKATEYQRTGILPLTRQGVTARMTVKDYAALDTVKIVRKREILDAWRQGEVPVQGYVWKD